MNAIRFGARLVAAGLVLTVLAGCQRDAAPSGAVPPEPLPAPVSEGQGAASSASAVPVLADVIEHDPRYVVGISYPPGAAADPGLARALHDYAQAARGELRQAVQGLDEPPRAPYELSLGFRETLRTADVVAVAADGSLYTGGAHGMPLVARYVWLPRQQRMLTAPTLLASPGEEVVYRVLHPGGRARQRAFNTFGNGYDDLFPGFGFPNSALLAPGKALTAALLQPVAAGCYPWRDGPGMMFGGGVWGHLDVGRACLAGK